MIAYIYENIVYYWCQGCKHTHSVPFPRWTFNNDVTSPTISPSVRHFYTRSDKTEVTICHYFIREGKIEYCSDSKHEFAGQTLPLQDIPEDYGLPGRNS